MKENNNMTNAQIEQINNILNELKQEQQRVLEDIQKKFKIIMHKLMKMEEHNEIIDMTNQIFEIRLSNMEDFLHKIQQSLNAK